MNEVPPFDLTWFRGLFGFIVGLSLGSFITMLSYRLPRHLSIVTPRSQCPRCKTALKALDLVPLFSWLAFKGECRHCHHTIGKRYPLIEIIAGLGSAVLFIILGFNLELLCALVFLILLMTFVVIRLEKN